MHDFAEWKIDIQSQNLIKLSGMFASVEIG